MRITLAFDVYGTLIDTNGVINGLATMMRADQAREFANTWRNKQLEYSFRRGLMNQYQDFSVCTLEALEYSCASMAIPLSLTQKRDLMAIYRVLPAFTDALEALKTLQNECFQLVAFSNGKADAVGDLLEHAGIAGYFEDIISVDEIETFKPNPEVYLHLLSRCQSEARHSWLVSGNPFDVMGAKSAGLRGIWLQRDIGTVYDPWADFAPDMIIRLLTDLKNAMKCRG